VPIQGIWTFLPSPVQGLQQADARLTDAALQIAGYGADSPQGANLDTVDLSSAMVELRSAKLEFAANLKVMKTAEQVQQHLLDVTA
jgi:flagellar basal body rod protein FlgC